MGAEGSGLEVKLPLAEMFYSPQGEGLYTGTMMFFIRLAGCSVGKKLTDGEYGKWRELAKKTLPVYVEKCCTYDGREFLCDTDFRTKAALTIDEILREIPKDCMHVCLTGGEPLMHGNKVSRLAWGILVSGERPRMLHIETSGTIALRSVSNFLCAAGFRKDVWITVSPKQGVLEEMIGMADEVKLLVGEGFDVDKVPDFIKRHKLVWVQPVNYEKAVDYINVQRCLDLIRRFPSWRLSLQMHKILGVR